MEWDSVRYLMGSSSYSWVNQSDAPRLLQVRISEVGDRNCLAPPIFWCGDHGRVNQRKEFSRLSDYRGHHFKEHL